jgi:UDP-N-acetylmuramyl-tripeptide synthetase/UDP-N-acetylmuramoyl-tripeptide--D-alanyl-D-alanine ligase
MADRDVPSPRPYPPRPLGDLLGPEIAVAGDPTGVTIGAVTADSRAVTPGALFAAMPGVTVDGAAYLPQALAAGAAAVLVAEAAAVPDGCAVPVLRAAEPRLALARVAARFHGPGPDTIVAVTGTSGKTSVAEFTRQIWAALGYASASLGTLGVVTSAGARYGALTTPDPVTLARTLADLRAAGITHLALEASSHGLDQRRLDGVTLAAGAFTNLGRDHLDYHPTVEDYLAAKLGLFERLLAPGRPAVVDMDGARAADVVVTATRRGLAVFQVGRRVAEDAAGLCLLGVTRDGFRQRLHLAVEGIETTVVLPLIGAYQVDNALTAAGLVLATGGPPAAVLAALEGVHGVPGRLEVAGELVLPEGRALAVVDYAHKPEALAACLDALRPLATGQLVCVVGCGGDRDRGKRPLMGEIAVEGADTVIVTDDNPRSEDPAAIRAAILAAAPEAIEIGDRRDAIRAAVGMLAEGDVLVVAGKGHETGQIVGGTVHPFSDRDEIAAALHDRQAALRDRQVTAPGPAERAPAATGADAPLWTVDDAVAATGAVADGIERGPIGGVSIDTRTLAPGDLFVALADVRDGHAFVTAAFAAGASAALVRDSYNRKRGDGLLLRVADPLRALEALGRAARARLAPDARVMAVTGSAGKTTTKEMLRVCLSAIAPTHASQKSYNNHWGVPLTLARMPAATRYAVFEIGMNHAGEITPLSRMVRPHVAVITTVEAVHIEHFADGVAGIARAKAEIFAGLEPGGVAVIPADNAHAGILRAAAGGAATVRPFSLDPTASDAVRASLLDAQSDGSRIAVVGADGGGTGHRFALGLPGRHNASNVVAVVAALAALGLPAARVDTALAALATMNPPPGRGARMRLATPDGAILVVDESYNANPASMRAALATLAGIPRTEFPRRIAVLGDMLELGSDAPMLHAGLADALAQAGVDVLLASGPNMAHLYAAVPETCRGAWAETAAGLEAALLATVRAGDVVMVKGSNGSRMAPLVAALTARHGAA